MSNLLDKNAKNLDELWDQLAESGRLVLRDTKRVHQAKEFSNNAGKMINVVRAKLVGCELAGTEPDIPQMGKFKGAPSSAVRSRRSRR